MTAPGTWMSCWHPLAIKLGEVEKINSGLASKVDAVGSATSGVRESQEAEYSLFQAGLGELKAQLAGLESSISALRPAVLTEYAAMSASS